LIGNNLFPVLANEFGGVGCGQAETCGVTLQITSRDEVEAFVVGHLRNELGTTLARFQMNSLSRDTDNWQNDQNGYCLIKPVGVGGE